MRKNGGEAGLVDGSMLSASYDKVKKFSFSSPAPVKVHRRPRFVHHTVHTVLFVSRA